MSWFNRAKWYRTEYIKIIYKPIRVKKLIFMMKGRKAFILFTEKIKWLLLLIIPCVLLIEFTSEKQPYFWDNRYDPSYAYLLNGLNLSLTHGNVGHIDHPGTTVQVMAAFIIKVTYQFRNKSIPLSLIHISEPTRPY